jgi:cytochrome c-type biogenesis protein
MGLGIPFVLVATSLHRAMDRLAVVRRHSITVMRTGGALLVVMGLLQVSGAWGDWLNAMRAWIGAYGTLL